MKTTVKVLLSLLSLAYLLTSAVVIVNSFAWLPGMPEAWYGVQRVLYWPFQPYLALIGKLMAGPSIGYREFTVASRAPFVVISLAALIFIVRGWNEHHHSKKG
ncbi:MAG: hypothetical protein HYX90_09970 [Chloroflexi bacterium]|nr:hypothetical protein [Chloroflexota bacterium]